MCSFASRDPANISSTIQHNSKTNDCVCVFERERDRRGRERERESVKVCRLTTVIVLVIVNDQVKYLKGPTQVLSLSLSLCFHLNK